MSEKNGLWAKVLLAFLVPTLAAVLTIGGVFKDVARNAEDVKRVDEAKASKELVNTQYDAILRRLDAIDRRLERLGR